MNEDRRRRRPTGEFLESEIVLSKAASARFVEIVETSTVDSDGRTYAERMHSRAERSRRKHSLAS